MYSHIDQDRNRLRYLRIELKLQKDGICHEGCELERDWILVLACSGEDFMEVVKDGQSTVLFGCVYGLDLPVLRQPQVTLLKLSIH